MDKAFIQRIEGISNIKESIIFLLKEGFDKQDLIKYVYGKGDKEFKERIEGLSNIKEDIEDLKDDGFSRSEIIKYIVYRAKKN